MDAKEINIPLESKPEHKAKNKKKKKKKFSLFRVAAVLTVLLLIWWFNNYTIRINTVTLHSKKIKEPVRIAVISDQHAHKLSISNRRIMKKVESTEPDAVFILGDMYTRDSSSDIRDIPLELAKSLVEDKYPVYFVSGEHDTDLSYIKKLKAIGVHVLDYRSEKLELKGNNIRVFGIDNVYYSDTFDLHNEFYTDENEYNILLAHIPNYEKFEHFGADLTICADTHGCMVQLPFDLGPVFYPDGGAWFPEILDKDMKVYDKGLFDYKGGQMFITSGLGDSPFPIRFNNRPEVAVIELMPE